ncbi:MAG: ATP-binding protein [Bacteroidetes bacterium]|nr:ATP-binding protein [Bacteroidota bacterium]
MKDIIRQKIIDSIAAPIPEFTRRDVYLPKIRGKAIAVIGMRRTGKSMFLWQVLSDRISAGAKRESLLYFGFEDERLAGMKATELQFLVEEFFRLFPELRDKHRTVFFLDEIQAVTGWEGFVRRLLETEKIEVFLSGSSAKLLSREVATSMRGRAMEALVHPFSFREYLRHIGREPETDVMRLPKAKRSLLEKDLREYLIVGGFPESVGAEARDRFDLLRGYVDTSLLRDVIERHEVSHPAALRWLIHHLLSNAGGLFSINKFYHDLRSQGMPIAKDTLHEYLAHLEDAFLIRSLSIAAESERKRMVNPRKVYPIDMGLIQLFNSGSNLNIGHALETCVMLELERRRVDVSYVRNSTGSEVDFLAKYPDGHRELLQVCTQLYTADVLKREIQGLLDAAVEHKKASAHLIVLDPERPSDIPKPIKWHSASQWLLMAGN